METKKNVRADLEKKRGLFFKTGLLLSLGVVFAAFEWQMASPVVEREWTPIFADPVIPIPVTWEQPIPPPPPPVGFDLAIVDNDTPIDIAPIVVDVETITGNPLPPDLFKPVQLTVETDTVFDSGFIDTPPGMNGFREYIVKNLNYPQTAKDNGISGTVIVQFVIDREGYVTEAQVVRSVDPLLDNEALRLLRNRNAPRWTPGMKNGKTVKARFSFPLSFRLQ
ncbi:MAG: energy transducer TonB [Bacteroidales bacterium]|jgi:protein TonB|nr:energy transducer TonB [Bacteroidales bacterium]